MSGVIFPRKRLKCDRPAAPLQEIRSFFSLSLDADFSVISLTALPPLTKPGGKKEPAAHRDFASFRGKTEAESAGC
jgi:hypothetical protein